MASISALSFSTYGEADEFIKNEIKPYKFNISSSRNQGRQVVKDFGKRKVQFRDTRGFVPITGDGCPFVNFGKEMRECQHGPRNNKKRTSQENISSEHSDKERKTRRDNSVSRKQDCAATIHIRKIIKFPQYKVDNSSPIGRIRQERNIARKLRKEFSPENTEQQLQVYVKFCGQHSCDHTLSEANDNIDVDNEVICKEEEMVGDVVTKQREELDDISESDREVGMENESYYVEDTENSYEPDREVEPCSPKTEDSEQMTTFIIKRETDEIMDTDSSVMMQDYFSDNLNVKTEKADVLDTDPSSMVQGIFSESLNVKTEENDEQNTDSSILVQGNFTVSLNANTKEVSGNCNKEAITPCPRCGISYTDHLQALDHRFLCSSEKSLGTSMEVKQEEKETFNESNFNIAGTDRENTKLFTNKKEVGEGCDQDSVAISDHIEHGRPIPQLLIQNSTVPEETLEDEESTLSCLYCKKMFYLKDKLLYREHAQRHLNVISKSKKVCKKLECQKLQKYHGPEIMSNWGITVKLCHRRSCDFLFIDESFITKHDLKVHKGKKYVCSKVDCHKVFTEYGSMRSHEIADHATIFSVNKIQGRKYVCSKTDCFKEFSALGSLKSHEIVDHATIISVDKKKGLKYVCSETDCHKEFSYMGSLKQHEYIDHGAEVSINDKVPKYVCSKTDCHKEFIFMGSLKQHEYIDHGAEVSIKDKGPKYVCSKADYFKVFGYESSLNWHETVDHGTKMSVNDNGPKCVYKKVDCHKVFNDQESLKVHEIVDHSNVVFVEKEGPKFVCRKANCLRVFSDLSSLKSHENGDHIKVISVCKNDQKFVCGKAFCHKSFRDQSSLMSHEITDHTNTVSVNDTGPKYVCRKDNCYKLFRDQDSLKSHENDDHATIVSGNKADCMKLFSVHGSLKLHEIVDHETAVHVKESNPLKRAKFSKKPLEKTEAPSKEELTNAFNGYGRNFQSYNDSDVAHMSPRAATVTGDNLEDCGPIPQLLVQNSAINKETSEENE